MSVALRSPQLLKPRMLHFKRGVCGRVGLSGVAKHRSDAVSTTWSYHQHSVYIVLSAFSVLLTPNCEAMFRAYRYGQTRRVYIYRLLARGTMEEKIYSRQADGEQRLRAARSHTVR
eukprot:2654484-Pyramimonas_sp.AAC.1